ncbi:response regulator [Nitrosopumilus sp.]|uniref:response regulator n=1 Tax=Nitrosopumilus sp. TaxID=2024843 RepID=UPI00247CBF65|nr:response regulator [Nitrosopumilus sp.]MCV0431842.1 response regulator [Nitrosopumilus sp.]
MNKTTCIVIDDDQGIVDLFCELLGVLDVNVLTTANNGMNAELLYKKHKPDIVFTDLQMPDYDGYYVVETIKDLNPDAKIVVITGDLNAGESDLFDLLHVPIINKPFDTHEIKQVITDVFLEENKPITPFEIQYRFKDDINFYACTVTYPQYRNLKQLPVIEECKIVSTKNNIQAYQDEMQRALDLVVQNDTSHIRKLSEIVRD